MNILDENIIVSQRKLLDAWRIHYRRIGGEVGWYGMKDQNDIIPLLHSLSQPTFFTRDRDFYQAGLRHPGYYLFFGMSAPLKPPSLFAAYCVTSSFAPRHNGWAK